MISARLLRSAWMGALAASAAVALLAASPSDLTGTWKLNKDASDDPKKKIEDAQGDEGGGSGGGGGGGGGGWGGGHHGGGGWGGGHRGGGSRSGSSGPFQSPTGLETLQIEHKDPRLVITDAEGKEHDLYTDGRKIEEERSYGGTTKITASWKDGHVVVETTPEHGAAYTETYAVTADGKQLTVTLKVKSHGRRQALEIKRVYDAFSATPPTATPEAPKPSSG